MTEESHATPRLTLNPVAQSCFAVSICSFGLAAVVVATNLALAVGLSLIACGYLAFGVLITSVRQSSNQVFPRQISSIYSDAENLVVQTMNGHPEPDFQHPDLVELRR